MRIKPEEWEITCNIERRPAPKEEVESYYALLRQIYPIKQEVSIETNTNIARQLNPNSRQ